MEIIAVSTGFLLSVGVALWLAAETLRAVCCVLKSHPKAHPCPNFDTKVEIAA
jgi:hypothetical protein